MRRWLVALTLAGSVPLVQAGCPTCASGFTVTSEEATFDGATFNVVRLSSPQISITAYTLGAWESVAAGAKSPALVLRHRRVDGVRLSLCSIDASRATRTDEQWNAYVEAVGLGLGNESEITEVTDSDKDPKQVKILGWSTRQALVRLAAEPGHERNVELHVLVAGPTAGLAFVLAGPESQVEAARRDFVFLLSRLNHGG